MHAMILAAGRGERLKPLTNTIPKALVEVGGVPMIERHVQNLAAAGFYRIVVNLGHLGRKIREHLGDGSEWGVDIEYSDEGDTTLETGGGIHRARPLLGNGPFLTVNADIVTDYPFARLRRLHIDRAHLVLVSNPDHNPEGDFSLQGSRVSETGTSRLTYAGLSLLSPLLFQGRDPGRFPLAPLLGRAMTAGQVSGEHFHGNWIDVGTDQRLKQANREIGLSD